MPHSQATSALPPLDWPHYGIKFIPSIKRGFLKYATFTGRASVGEYWWWILFLLCGWCALGLLSNLTNGDGSSIGFFGVILLLFWAGTLLPTLAVAVRRLHDTGRSGWYYFITFIPLVGGFILLAFLVGSTTPQAAQYGPPALTQPRLG
jgi:uncharacterized membrane protein YhaH (DUF805 family)